MQPDKLITLLDTITATLDQAAESIEEVAAAVVDHQLMAELLRGRSRESIEEVAAVVDHLRHARTAAIEQQMADSNGQPPDSPEKLHW